MKFVPRRDVTVRYDSNRPRRARSTAQKPGTIQVRRATSRDLSTLMRHRLAMDRELGRGRTEGIVAYARAYRRWTDARIRARHLIPFIALDLDGRSVGSGSIWLREGRPHRGDLHVRVPRIHGIYVQPAARRQGVATALLEAMLEWVRRHGYQRVSLRTTARARALYLQYGFRPTPEMELDCRK